MNELTGPGRSKQRTPVIQPEELYGLFTIIAGFDARFTRISWPQDKQDAERREALKDSWFSVIGHVPAEFSAGVVRTHYADHSETITPDVIKREWSKHADYLGRQRDLEQDLASVERARTHPASLDARLLAKAEIHVRKGMSLDAAVRLVLERRRQIAVACPACKALPFSPCRNRSGDRELPANIVHPSRRELADEADDDGREVGAA